MTTQVLNNSCIEFQENILVEKADHFDVVQVNWGHRLIKFIPMGALRQLVSTYLGIYFSKDIPRLVAAVLVDVQKHSCIDKKRLDNLKNTLSILKESNRYSREKTGVLFSKIILPKLEKAKKSLESEYQKLELVESLYSLRNGGARYTNEEKTQLLDEILSIISKQSKIAEAVFTTLPSALAALLDVFVACRSIPGVREQLFQFQWAFAKTRSSLYTQYSNALHERLHTAAQDKNIDDLNIYLRLDERVAIEYLAGNHDLLESLCSIGGDDDVLSDFIKQLDAYKKSEKSGIEYVKKYEEILLKVQSDQSQKLSIDLFKEYMDMLLKEISTSNDAVSYQLALNLNMNMTSHEIDGTLTQFQKDIPRGERFIIVDLDKKIASDFTPSVVPNDFALIQRRKIYDALTQEEATKWGLVLESVVTQSTRLALADTLIHFYPMIKCQFQKSVRDIAEQINDDASSYMVQSERPHTPTQVTLLRGRDGLIEALEVSIQTKMPFGLGSSSPEYPFIYLGIGGIDGHLTYKVKLNSEGSIRLEDYSCTLKMYN